jgi:DNA-binding LytR/AlgR family response regulator
MPTQSTIEEVTAAITKGDAKPDRRLLTARSDLRIAQRSLNSAIDTDGADRASHLTDTIQRLEMALGALKQAQKAGV